MGSCIDRFWSTLGYQFPLLSYLLDASMWLLAALNLVWAMFREFVNSWVSRSKGRRVAAAIGVLWKFTVVVRPILSNSVFLPVFMEITRLPVGRDLLFAAKCGLG